MASVIEILWRQALKTFTGRKNEDFQLCQKNFEKLKELMNEIKADDVKVDKRVLEYVCRQSAPMCVMDIFENQDITIAIFILKHGVILPMHDHPEMHGLLKVISGVVKIDSYTLQNTDCIMRRDKEIIATKHSSVVVQDNDPACVLTPTDRNLHEITCLQGPAAFLDILSPPYIVDEDGIGQRPCTYFKRDSSYVEFDGNSEKVKLVKILHPPDFYSVRLKYLGPQLR